MSTPVLTSKLDALGDTISLVGDSDVRALARALAAGKGRHALAIGSGGSAIAAEYLGRCRDTLGLGPTSLQTPMQAVVEHHDLLGSDVWIFSAGADNADATAAARACADRHAAALHLVTRNPDGMAAGTVRAAGGVVHATPVADVKDGFLATHSLVSAITALLLAADLASRDPRGSASLVEALASHARLTREPSRRLAWRQALAGLRTSDTLVVAGDPLLRPAAVLLDTSLWEASLCAVQTTDPRNLAHGRHAWLHHRAEGTFVLALVGAGSADVWTAVERELPSPLRRHALAYGSCGRLDNALAVVDALAAVEAIGAELGVDPGRPGVADFGRALYANPSLQVVADGLPPQVRHKRAAMARSDADRADGPLEAVGRERLRSLGAAAIGGVVLDYDGTIVTTRDRFSPPRSDVVDELVRLHRAGVRIGVATGRGGSAGEELRKVLPGDMLPSVLIGYYNGGHLRMADVDIRDDAPVPDPAIAEAAEWLRRWDGLLSGGGLKEGPIQITVAEEAIGDPYGFARAFAECPAFSEGRVHAVSSGHSFDIVPAASTKLAVVEAMGPELTTGPEVLCFGDSGMRSGNDNALLSHPLGISVGDVCGSPDGCWSMFGAGPTGPDALLRSLRALVQTRSGEVRLDVSALGLDNHRKTGT